MSGERTELSPNFTPGWPRGKPQALIVHSTRSGVNWTDAQERDATINWFGRSYSQVSAHWVIDASGTAVRIVDDHNRAWHAAEHNDYAFGIELTQGTPTTPYHDGHYEGLVRICKEYYPWIAPMHVVVYQNGSHGYTGHEDTAQGRRVGKSDPGSLFDWTRFINMLLEDDMATEAEQRVAHLGGRLVVVALGGGQLTAEEKALLKYLAAVS